MKPAVRQLLLGRGLSVTGVSSGNPLYIAHRGGALVYPEETLEAYRAGLSAGVVATEQDVHALSDGSLAVMHDTTVDRTTTGTGTVVSFTPTTWNALDIDADTQNVPGFGNALKPVLFPAVVTELRGRSILVPEIKVSAVKQSLVDALMSAGVRRNQAIVTSFTLSDLAPAVSAGYPALLAVDTSTLSISAAQAAGVGWVGVSTAAADSVFTAWRDAGFKVISYDVNRRYRRDQLLALGVVGFYSDDPMYLSGQCGAQSRDAFSSGRWTPGMLASDDGVTAASRGAISAGGWWGWNNVADVSGFGFGLQGWAGPLTAGSFSITFGARINSVNAADTTRWFNLFLADSSMSDQPYRDSTTFTAEKGYTFLRRKNGNLVISRRDGATTTALISTTNAAVASVDGVEHFMKLTVTPTTLRWAVVDNVGTELFAVSATDSTYRGGYLHLGRNGCIPEFRNIVIA